MVLVEKDQVVLLPTETGVGARKFRAVCVVVSPIIVASVEDCFIAIENPIEMW